MKVCYFTSKVASDTRVFEKECRSLAKAGYEVTLVAPNARDELKDGVQIIGVPYAGRGAVSRLLRLPWLLFRRARAVRADIYHFHDPASLPYALLLKWQGRRVIFDSFEDHPTLLLEHKQVPPPLLRLLAIAYALVEQLICGQFDAVICCYHWTRDRLANKCSRAELVFNFPVVDNEHEEKAPMKSLDTHVICYAGLLSEIWNLETVVGALARLPQVKFLVAGHGNEGLISHLKTLPGGERVEFLGSLPREDVKRQVYEKASAGIALLDYIPLCHGNVGNLSNNKLFEYMLAGLPVICTDFYLWKEVVEGHACGICVNANDPAAVATAIERLIADPQAAHQMAENGRRAVLTTYNWATEEEKLLNVYSQIAAELSENYRTSPSISRRLSL